MRELARKSEVVRFVNGPSVNHLSVRLGCILYAKPQRAISTPKNKNKDEPGVQAVLEIGLQYRLVVGIAPASLRQM